MGLRPAALVIIFLVAVGCRLFSVFIWMIFVVGPLLVCDGYHVGHFFKMFIWKAFWMFLDALEDYSRPVASKMMIKTQCLKVAPIVQSR